MKCLHLLILDFIAQQTFAQDINYVKTYYPLINKAEILVIDGKYKDALDQYQKAFSLAKTQTDRNTIQKKIENCTAVL